MLVLTETALDAHDVQRLATLHAPEEVRAHVVIPSGTDQSTLDQIVDDIARTDLDELAEDVDPQTTDEQEVATAQQALNQSVRSLSDVGVTASGSLVPKAPVSRVAELAISESVDEIIVITEPHLVTDVLRRDWATRLRHKVHLPVLHFIAGTDQVVS
jgi:hypothetical protein